MWNGGNQWSGWCAYLSFFDRVAGLDLPIYEKWRHYEAAAIHGGPRMMHKDFCIVSDRPEILTVDERNRPHNDTGPFCRWRDGWSLYAFHGVTVPAYVIERPHEITVEKIEAEGNAEVKRVMIERFGHGRYLAESGLKPIHTDDYGTLYQKRGRDGEAIMTVVRVVDVVKNDDGTEKVHYLPVNAELCPMVMNEHTGQIEYGEPQKMTARNAVASTFGLRGEQYDPEYQS